MQDICQTRPCIHFCVVDNLLITQFPPFIAVLRIPDKISSVFCRPVPGLFEIRASPGHNFFTANELRFVDKNGCKNYTRPLICGLTAYLNPLKFVVVYQAADEKIRCSWIICRKTDLKVRKITDTPKKINL